MEFALVDDPEALHAALALVDECAALSPAVNADEEQALALAAVASFDSPSALQERGNGDDSARSLSASSVSSSSPMSAVGQGGRKKAAKTRNYNPNRAREEEKRELLYLRGKVVEMEDKLHALQEAKRAKESALALEGEASSSALRPLSTRARNVWEEMANHQLEQRLQSERENRHLKAVLEAQIKIAKGLEKLLQSRATAKGMETAGFSSRSRRIYASKANRSGADLFQELIDGLEESYNELDSVFRANGLAGMEMSFRDAKMCEDKDGNLYMEMYANKVLPFDVRESGNAAWQYFAHSMEHIPFRLMYQKDPKNLEYTNDMVVQSFGMELHANGTKADFQVKQTQRRFVEEDREVIVWRSFIDPVEFSGKPLSGAEFLEKGYIVVKPSADDESLTLLQSCFIVTPVLPVRNLDEGAITGALTDFVLSGTAATIAASHQMIENILFDQAAKARSRV